MEKTQIVILAAGKGTRMESEEPKALAMLKNKPFLQHILDTVKSLNMPIEPVVVVGYKKDRVMEVIGTDTKYAFQEEQLGTGHALKSAKDYINKDADTIFVLSTDQPVVSKETILKILNTHKEKNSTVTIGTVMLPDFEDWRTGLSRFGRIIRDENGKVIKNVEAKDANEEEFKITEVNPAIYTFDSKWLWENIDNINNENAQKEYYLTDLIGLAREQGEGLEAVPTANILEGLQPNTKAELEILESLLD